MLHTLGFTAIRPLYSRTNVSILGAHERGHNITPSV